MDCSDKVIVASDLGNLLSMFEQVAPLIESVNSSSSHVFFDNKNIDITSSKDNKITSIADAVALPADINIASPPNDSLSHSIASFDTTSNFNVVANCNGEVAIFQHGLAYDDVCVDECVIYDFETGTDGYFSELDANLLPENTVNDDQSCLNDSSDEIHLSNCKNSFRVDDINADNHINNERVGITCDVTDITEAADMNSRHHSNSRHQNFKGSFMNSDEDDDDDLLPCHARHQQQLQQNQRSEQDVIKLQQDPTQEQHLAPSQHHLARPQPQMQTMAPLSPQPCNFGRGIDSAIRLKKGGRFQGRGRSCCLNNNNDVIIDNSNINNNNHNINNHSNNNNNNNNDDATKPTVNNHNNFTDNKSSIRRQQYNTLRRKCSSSNSSNHNNVTRRQNYQKKSEQEPVNVNVHQNYYYNNIFEDDAEDGSQKYIDKIPTYYTALSRPTRGIVRNIRINISDLDFPEDDDGSSLMCVDDNILLDKIPAYHSCFTNSTKYDVNDVSVNNNNYINNNSYNYINNNYINNNKCIYSNDFTFTSGPDYDSYNNNNNNNSYNDIACNDCDESNNNNNNNNNNKVSIDNDHLFNDISSHSMRDKDDNTHHISNSKSMLTSNVIYNNNNNNNNNNNEGVCFLDNEGPEFRFESKSKRSAMGECRNEFGLEENKMDRKIVHIGRIPRSWSSDKLRNMFEVYGPIVECSVHFRDIGDNYGFVTFRNVEGAFKAIENGHKLPGCERLDICLGGRRKFCRQDYTDLDGNMQVKEEFVPGVIKSEKSFGELLREATKNR